MSKFCQGEVPAGSVWDPCGKRAEEGRDFCADHTTRYGEDEPRYQEHVEKLRRKIRNEERRRELGFGPYG